jgi:hypothetical protein
MLIIHFNKEKNVKRIYLSLFLLLVAAGCNNGSLLSPCSTSLEISTDEDSEIFKNHEGHGHEEEEEEPEIEADESDEETEDASPCDATASENES